MKYKTNKLSDLEIFEVTVSGTLTQDTRKDIHLKTLSEFNRSKYYKLLIDITSSKMPQNYTLLNSLDLIDFLKKIDSKKHTKIAFIGRFREQAQKKFLKFSRLMAKRQIKLFTDYDEAINWLGEKKEFLCKAENNESSFNVCPGNLNCRLLYE